MTANLAEFLIYAGIIGLCASFACWVADLFENRARHPHRSASPRSLPLHGDGEPRPVLRAEEWLTWMRDMGAMPFDQERD